MNNMSHIAVLLAVVFFMVACGRGKQETMSLMTDSQRLRAAEMICGIRSCIHEETEEDNGVIGFRPIPGVDTLWTEDSFIVTKNGKPYPECAGVIEFVCDMEGSFIYTQEAAARLDSAGWLLVRGAERNLDTVVNHAKIRFITEE